VAVGGKPPSKIFVKAAFGLIISIKVPAYYFRKLTKFFTSAILQKISHLEIPKRSK